jgi:hypothetical protein
MSWVPSRSSAHWAVSPATGRRGCFAVPVSGAALLRRVPVLLGAAILGLSALLPWSRRYPYSRRSGLDTARIVLGLHRHIALLPSRSLAWLWCLVPAAGALAWAVAWLAPRRAGLMVLVCGLVGGSVAVVFGLSLAGHDARFLASGPIVAVAGALTLILSYPVCRIRLASPHLAEDT